MSDGKDPGVLRRCFFSRRMGIGLTAHDDLYSINTDGTGIATLADTSDDEEYEDVSSSGRVTFRRTPAAGGNVDLYSVNIDGTALATLSGTADMSNSKHSRRPDA
ncbi:MAG: hypothetical protein ACREV5_18520 [Steroidobacter sp.]